MIIKLVLLLSWESFPPFITHFFNSNVHFVYFAFFCLFFLFFFYLVSYGTISAIPIGVILKVISIKLYYLFILLLWCDTSRFSIWLIILFTTWHLNIVTGALLLPILIGKLIFFIFFTFLFCRCWLCGCLYLSLYLLLERYLVDIGWANMSHHVE